ncbi:hypothetical protein HK101_002651, partial [Irineochytrium annulatum]
MHLSLVLSTLAVATSVSAKMQFTGVNEAGLEFGMTINGPSGGTVPGTFFAPNPAAIQHATQSFANMIRIPFMWERMQPTANGALDNAYLGTVDAAVQVAIANNAVAVLDVHNYARYNSQLLGTAVPSSALANLWSQLAKKYASNPNVWFNIMNEPHGIDTVTWFNVAQDAINAIRAAGATNKITVPGNCFTGAHSWVKGQCDTGVPNAQASLAIKDPMNNFIFDMHQYLDQDFSGTNGQECVQNGPAVLADATNWLRTNGKQAIIGEIGVIGSAACQSALDATLSFMDSNSDVWVGYTYWAAGSAW